MVIVTIMKIFSCYLIVVLLTVSVTLALFGFYFEVHLYMS